MSKTHERCTAVHHQRHTPMHLCMHAAAPMAMAVRGPGGGTFVGLA